MNSTAQKAPPTRRIDYAAALMARLRIERHPPLMRYAVVLAVGSFGEGGATGEQVAKITLDPNISATLSHAADNTGLLRRVQPTSPKQRVRYFLTPAGLAMLDGLLNPQPALALHF